MNGRVGGTAGEPTDRDAPGKPQPGLHVVATPIGNLEDLSPRAQRVLAGADLVLCEDTRVTGGLLHRLGLKRPMLAYHEHNAARVRPIALDRLSGGAVVALVSDAGTPCIADPGYKLVREAVERGIAVFAVPGPSALLAALAISGLPTDRFFFQGFLPAKAAARDAVLAELAAIPATLVIYEAPHRIAATLAAAAARLGPRDAAVGRELTKRFEEVQRGTLAALAERFAASERIRGELVLVVAPPDSPATVELPTEEVDAQLQAALLAAPPRRAAALVAGRTGQSANELYRRALALRRP
jgi:16S rRNA (cytidine1402-2'-O)-methyltransferase